MQLIERVARTVVGKLDLPTELLEDEWPLWRDEARHVIAEVFDWLAEPGKDCLDAGMSAADDAMDCDYCSDMDGNNHEYQYLRSDAPAEIYAAMLAAKRKEALGDEPNPPQQAPR